MSSAQTIIFVVILGIISLVGLLVLGPVAGVATDLGTSAGDVEIRYPNTSDTTTLDVAISEEPNLFDVQATEGNAVTLDGEGYVDDDLDAWYGGDWTVCATGRLAGDANTAATYSVFAYDNATVLLQYSDGDWRGYHYQGGDSAYASVSASSPTEFSSLCASWDNSSTELTLDNGAASDTGALTNSTPPRDVALNWVGTVDEIRLINATLDATQRSTYADDPVHPLDAGNHTARYMFNEGSGDDTLVYYADANATIVDGDWGSGVAGPDLQEGSDYEVTYSPLAISTVDGGYLADAPAVFVTWDSGLGGPLGSVISGVGSAFDFIPIIMLVAMAAVVIAVVQRMRI